MVKNGKRSGRQQYQCKACKHQFSAHNNSRYCLEKAFHSYCHGKQTLFELSNQTGKSVRTLQRHFDSFVVQPSIPLVPSMPVNLIADGTFFSRSDGVLVFRAQTKNIYWKFITSETLSEVTASLDILDKRGYIFQSVVLDGRRGVIKLFEERYPGIHIQLCQFHQTQIIRRYTTYNPKTDCGRDIKTLMRLITQTDEECFGNLLQTYREEHDSFLKERNENGKFKHPKLRSAFRSLKTNLPYLFTYKKYPQLNIPNTTNSCDGSFAHWKQKVKIHRGLKKKRRDKMVNYLLGNP